MPEVSSYSEDKAVVEEIREAIPTMVRAGDQRHRYWEEMERHLIKLKSIAKNWNNKRSELNKKIVMLRRENRRFFITCLLMIVVPIVVAIFWNR